MRREGFRRCTLRAYRAQQAIITLGAPRVSPIKGAGAECKSMLLRLITHEHNDPAAGSLRKRTHIHETRARVSTTHRSPLALRDASLCLSTRQRKRENVGRARGGRRA